MWLWSRDGKKTFLSSVFSETSESKGVDPDLEQFLNMAWVKGGTFVRGSNFKENQDTLKLCRKYDRACKLWWFSDEFPLKLVLIDRVVMHYF